MRRPSRRTPFPFDIVLSHPEAGIARLLLLADQQGSKLLRHRVQGTANVAPTDFSYGSQSPFTRRTSVFNRLVMGLGQPVEETPESQRYDHAMGMDWSCGLGTLATAWVPPIQLGTGPIKSIETGFVYGARRLFVLSGQRVYESTAAEINEPGDFTLLRDFGTTPPTPPIPTATIVGTPGSNDLEYRVIYSSQSYRLIPQGGNFDPSPIPPWSDGATCWVPNGPDVLDGNNYVELTWPPPPAGFWVTLYRINRNNPEEGARGWYCRGPVTSPFRDNSQEQWFVGAGISPPAGAQASPAPVHLLMAPSGGVMRLVLGMESGPFFAWNGVDWQYAIPSNPGRILASDGNLFYRTTSQPTGTQPPGYTLTYETNRDPLIVGGNWSNYTQAAAPVTRVVPHQGTLVTFQEDRILVGKGFFSQADPNVLTVPHSIDITPDRGLPSHSNNGRVAVVWRGDIYAPYGMGLYKITVTSVANDGSARASIEPVGLERLFENSSPVQGRITALAPWGPWHLWWAAWDQRAGSGGTTYVGKYGAWLNPAQAKDPQAQSVGVMHGALESWPGKQASWMQHTLVGEPSGNGRMYLGFTDGGLTWTILPAQGPFAPHDPNCVFRSTGYTLLSRHSMGFQADDKRFFDLTAFGPSIDNSRRVRFYYTLPDGEEHEITGSISEGGEPLTIPGGALAKWIQIKVVMETDDPGDTPVVEGIALGEQLRPSATEQLSFTAHLGPRLRRRDGHLVKVRAAELLKTLRQLEQQGDDVEILLPDGERINGAVVDFADHYLEGATTEGARHDVGITLLTFHTNS